MSTPVYCTKATAEIAHLVVTPSTTSTAVAATIAATVTTAIAVTLCIGSAMNSLASRQTYYHDFLSKVGV